MNLYGAMMFPTDYAIQPVELAKAVEERGLDSLFFPEHTHIPTSRRSPWPGGGELPMEYSHTHDLFVAMTAAAVATKRIKIGSGICLVIERDPIVLAKEVASLDVVSGGRLIFGIGGGWNAEEMENHGTNFKRRWALLRERVLAMKAIWKGEKAEFHGEFVNFDPIWSWPKPVQPGGPKILLGSEASKAIDRVVEYCDGWMPINRGGDGAKLKAGIDQLREKAKQAGRRFEDFHLGIFGVPPKEDAARRFQEMGFSHLIFGLPPAKADKVLPMLDTYAALAEKLRKG
ncbi:MAG TPA: LLM class F420-dependent oxidoreductase [Candidatus Binataceae bacterium]|nr:LLM class F420-dependent oxidoreductase [Candidatus Binataceae bacterium]